MHVVEHSDPDAFSARSHPWRGSASDPSHRYCDLKQRPELIRSSLEDFQPWPRHAATETFYRLLERLNGPESILETNDCAFSGPDTNEMAGFDKALQCSGRVMLLFRDLPKNTDTANVYGLTETIARALSQKDEGYQWGVIGATIVPVRFTTLPGTEDDQRGAQLMLSFWAWGDDEPETMANLDRTLTNLSAVLRDVSAP
ncbi:MAG: hypothetical protein ACI8S6_001987 [Myxococcota bacterium]|jgi:hypothetical protein